jgi:hypothetical protein
MKSANHPPAARILGRKGFISENPYLKLCSEVIKNPDIYRKTRVTASNFDKEFIETGD